MKRIAPPAAYEVAPGLGQFTDEVLFGEVWERSQLSPRDRSLVTVATLISTGKTAQLGSHVGRALDNGVKPQEIGEVITQLAFYSGWPNAMSAVSEVKKVFDERKIGPVSNSDAERVVPDAASETARTKTVDSNVAPTSPALAELTNRVLFGEVWTRPDMAARDRSLVTVAALIAIGQPEQLPFHLNRAMDNGLTPTEAAEIPAHIAFYAGWPRAMSAVPVLEKVFASRQNAAAESTIKMVRAQSESAPGPEAYFTGEVTISTRYQGEPPARVGGATVSFAAGARTAWHTHPLGQTLYIVSGLGWVQKDGAAIEEVRPGDVVWIPPNVRHWHGASATHPMVHFAVAESLDGTAVTWMDKVTDQDYRVGPATK